MIVWEPIYGLAALKGLTIVKFDRTKYWRVWINNINNNDNDYDSESDSDNDNDYEDNYDSDNDCEDDYDIDNISDNNDVMIV